MGCNSSVPNKRSGVKGRHHHEARTRLAGARRKSSATKQSNGGEFAEEDLTSPTATPVDGSGFTPKNQRSKAGGGRPRLGSRSGEKPTKGALAVKSPRTEKEGDGFTSVMSQGDPRGDKAGGDESNEAVPPQRPVHMTEVPKALTPKSPRTKRILGSPGKPPVAMTLNPLLSPPPEQRPDDDDDGERGKIQPLTTRHGHGPSVEPAAGSSATYDIDMPLNPEIPNEDNDRPHTSSERNRLTQTSTTISTSLSSESGVESTQPRKTELFPSAGGSGFQLGPPRALAALGSTVEHQRKGESVLHLHSIKEARHRNSAAVAGETQGQPTGSSLHRLMSIKELTQGSSRLQRARGADPAGSTSSSPESVASGSSGGGTGTVCLGRSRGRSIVPSDGVSGGSPGQDRHFDRNGTNPSTRGSLPGASLASGSSGTQLASFSVRDLLKAQTDSKRDSVQLSKSMPTGSAASSSAFSPPQPPVSLQQTLSRSQLIQRAASDRSASVLRRSQNQGSRSSSRSSSTSSQRQGHNGTDRAGGGADPASDSGEISFTMPYEDCPNPVLEELLGLDPAVNP